MFAYGSDGLRRSMTVGNDPTIHFALDGQNVVQEGHLDQGDFVADVTYMSGPRGVEYRKDESTGAVRWYLYDGLGSVVGEVDANGNVTSTTKYDVYGSIRGSTGSSDSQHKFVGSLGHTTEPDTGGLIYMRARWMDPITGRFISEDPAGDGFNWYSYCDGNPINYVDGSGNIKLQVNRPYEWKGYIYRLDKEGDIHIWQNGKFLGAIYKDLTIRHGGKGVPKAFLKFLAKNTDFFVDAGKGAIKGMLGIGAITSLDGYARSNPADFIDLMCEIFGTGGDMYDNASEGL